MDCLECLREIPMKSLLICGRLTFCSRVCEAKHLQADVSDIVPQRVLIDLAGLEKYLKENYSSETFRNEVLKIVNIS